MKKSDSVLFKTTFRGYKKASVDSYIAAMHEQFAKERQQLESQLRNQTITIHHLEAKLQQAQQENPVKE